MSAPSVSGVAPARRRSKAGRPRMPRRTEAVSRTTLTPERIDRAYDRLSTIYNWVFGPPFHHGRARAIERLRLSAGDRILEVGIGTALTASLYPADSQVVGIDVSEAMLSKASESLAARALHHVALVRMDATNLAFADGSFDVVFAAYVLSAVAQPVDVLREMLRVCRPGGRVVFLNHFRSDDQLRSTIDRWVAPIASRLGFRTDLALTPLLRQAGVPPTTIEITPVPPVWSLVAYRAPA